MTSLRTLNDAFTELERRADAATAATPLTSPSRRPPRLIPVAAGVAVVAVVATVVAVLAPGANTGSAPSGAQPTTGPATAPPPTPARPAIPGTPEELAERFRTVLGDTATFTVTETGFGARVVPGPPSPRPGPTASVPDQPGGAPTGGGRTEGVTIIGTLTASGLTGGFHLGVRPSYPGERLWCGEGNADPARCSVQQLADGSTLVIRRELLEGSPNGVDHAVRLIRGDGVDFEFHVSNQRSPKGASDELAPHPPLTIDQMIAILTSDRW